MPRDCENTSVLKYRGMHENTTVNDTSFIIMYASTRPTKVGPTISVHASCWYTCPSFVIAPFPSFGSVVLFKGVHCICRHSCSLLCSERAMLVGAAGPHPPPQRHKTSGGAITTQCDVNDLVHCSPMLPNDSQMPSSVTMATNAQICHNNTLQAVITHAF